MKNDYEIKTGSKLLGVITAKDARCASRRGRRQFWPKGESRFTFTVEETEASMKRKGWIPLRIP